MSILTPHVNWPEGFNELLSHPVCNKAAVASLDRLCANGWAKEGDTCEEREGERERERERERRELYNYSSRAKTAAGRQEVGV